MSDKMLVKAPQPKSTAAAVKPSLTAASTTLLQRKCACGEKPGAAGECAACKDAKPEEKKPELILQRKANGSASPTAIPSAVHDVVRSPGQPLDASTRAFMEPRFGRTFDGVRVHTDSQAAASAQAVNAKAYTVGQDIVFDHGQYQPQTHQGKHLLAHELAHTVQQQGMQRYSNDVQMGGAADTQLEREADRAAHAVVHSTPDMQPVPLPLAARPAQPILSRAPADTPPPSDSTPSVDSGEVEPDRAWEALPASSPLTKLGVTHQSKLRPGVIKPTVRAFRLANFPLPAEKGPVLKAWQNRAKAGALQSVIGLDDTPKSALKQERPSTDDLRKIWLTKVGWDAQTAPANWAAAGGDNVTPFKPTVNSKTCEMDHTIELQIGGTNIKENIQALDKEENGKSGREIFAYLKDKAKQIRDAMPAGLETVILQFDDVTQAAATCKPKTCCAVEQKAQSITGAAPATGEAGAEQTEAYRISAGGSETDLHVPSGSGQAKKGATKIDIHESPIPQNVSASELIPGMVLRTLHRKAKGTDVVDACIESQNCTKNKRKTRLPITIDAHKGNVPLKVAKETGRLTLQDKTPHIQFTYPYLSKGEITKLDYDDQKGLSGEGELTPSIPFLSKMKLKVRFAEDEFAIIGGLDPKKIKSPLPGAKLTKAELALVLAPEFEPSGELGFDYEPGGKKLMDAALKISKDANGLVADGTMHAYLPGVDNAEGKVEYRNHQWSGGVKVESTQIKLKYIKSGMVVVGFNERGVDAEGKVILDIPRTDGVEVSLTKRGSKWVFRGKGTFDLPKLDPVRMDVEYDGNRLDAEGETGFKFQGLKGRIKVRYRDEKVSGEGSIEFEKGKAKGKLNVKMSPARKFSGEGELTYQITESLVATGGIIIDENEKVTLKGILELTKPIKLFEPIKGDYKFFKVGISIPIPGASIGPVGIKVRIEGALSAGYQIGPGELQKIKVEAVFNPLEENPDLDLKLSGRLYIPASAYISGSVSGSVNLDIGVASAGGGLTVTGTAMLEGFFAAQAEAHYQKSRFDVKADFEVALALKLMLGLTAFVVAEAGVSVFSVTTRKDWQLASYTYDPGLKLGMKVPLYYASDQPFRPPSLDQITWVAPEISPSAMLDKVFGSSKQQEKEL